MATGKRLLEDSMPHNFKQGFVYPTHYIEQDQPKPHGGSRKRNVGCIRKAGQSKVRRQLNKEMYEELNNTD